MLEPLGMLLLLLLVVVVSTVLKKMWSSKVSSSITAKQNAEVSVSATYYLYFPDESRALPVVKRLEQEKFIVESKQSAADDQWLVLANKDLSAEQHFMMHDFMEKLAADNGGEYDGDEVEVKT